VLTWWAMRKVAPSPDVNLFEMLQASKGLPRYLMHNFVCSTKSFSAHHDRCYEPLALRRAGVMAHAKSRAVTGREPI
jgi:hypothetical protein